MAWLPVVVAATPAQEPVGIGEARNHCKIDGTDSDTALTIFIAAARERVELETATKLITQTVSMRCSSFRDLENLPCAPLQSITSVKYLDTDGTEQTLSTSVYEAVLVGLEPTIRLKPSQSWPSVYDSADAVRVVAVAGYGDNPADVPKTARYAILLLIEDANRNRGETIIGQTVQTLPNGVWPLLVNLRKN